MSFKYLKRKWKKQTLTISRENVIAAVTTFLMSTRTFPADRDIMTIDFEGLDNSKELLEIAVYYKNYTEEGG